MLQLNLLPDVKKEFLRAKRQRNVVMIISIFAMIIFAAIAVILIVFRGYQGIEKNLRTDDIKNYTAQIEAAKKDDQLDEYLTVQNQLSQIDSLKTAQPVFSRLFDYLKQLNPAAPNSVEISSARLTGASGETGAGLEIQGTVKDMAALNVYVNTLKEVKITYSEGKDGEVKTENLFESVNAGEFGTSDGENGEKQTSFTISLTYNAAAFAFNTANIKLSVEAKTTSDSVENAPTFNAKPATTEDSSQTVENSDNSNAGGAQ